ncbi:putative protein/MSMEI_2664 [Leucobacter aridicollis]|uniref:ATPase n=1 Tax=Leucobacter aridicollis TaxID=283878 RepID=A0A852R2K0_9MICO|nr:DUF349 domain-containing protein [Leucobacter aridicollis]MBL3682073.1 DUF349 domain-containing protein [Leucobacter aridicollis]MCS3428244.1 hypothetical protein [Leucobacter aridicollis]NYD26877.1 hypothetical protein [Leucobacter aridicollis]RKQ94468.1 uncharacterized protein DUF349 [Mycolicibacterium mucogenicum 261Sha1.1M5]
MSEATNEQPWGRVDEDRTVYVREGEGERAVGAFPDGTPEEALAYFERKFADLAGAVTLLEARIARGTADASVAGTVKKLEEQLVEPAAVGDIASLRERVAKLSEKAAAFGEQQQQEREAAREEAVAKREAIVAEAEQLAAQPEASIRWKDTSAAFERLFTEWQNAQRSGPHVPKPQADAMWKRFRAARQSFDTARRAHFSQMDANNKDVKGRKEKLIASAEALADRGLDGIPAYRNLLEDWKQAGRASRKLDDQLWARFKAAGDVLYQAKAEEVAQTNEEYQANLVAKQAVIADATPILELSEHTAARKQLTAIQLRWDEIGRVPREALREIEGQLRRIEDHVKGLEDEHWRKTNPETKARSEGLRGQLESSIAELEAEIAGAKDAKAKASAEEKLATQKSWLAALGD